MKITVFIFSFLFSIFAVAHAGLEFGLAGGYSKPFAGDQFKSQAAAGDSSAYWLSYNFNPAWSAGLDYNTFDFDSINVTSEMISLAGKYRWNHENFYHPFFSLGLGSATSKNFSSDKHSGVGAFSSFGVEFDFSWLTVGGLFRWNYADKTVGALTTNEKYSHAQALIPMVSLSFHWPFDHQTAKAEVPPSAKPTVQTVKIVDSDFDGVADENDLCSNTQAGIKVNQFGCAETEKASIKLQIIFDAGKSLIPESAHVELNKLSAFMKRFPETKVEVAGHTDNKGSAAKNTKLSAARAEAVAQALAATGIDKSRITAKGYGPSQPIATNDTIEGRSQNRRVVAEITTQVEVQK